MFVFWNANLKQLEVLICLLKLFMIFEHESSIYLINHVLRKSLLFEFPYYAMIVDKYDGFCKLEFIESHVVANLKYNYTLHIEIFNALCI